MFVSMASLELIQDQQKQRFIAARLGEKPTVDNDLDLMVNLLLTVSCCCTSTVYSENGTSVCL